MNKGTTIISFKFSENDVEEFEITNDYACYLLFMLKDALYLNHKIGKKIK